MRSHAYDEVIYVVDGEGVFHLDGGETLSVLAVFHPAGDPGSRAS